VDDLGFDRLHDETLSDLSEPGPDPRLSRRRLMSGAGSGFVLAASGLLLPEGVAGIERQRPLERIQNDPRERDRNNKNRNNKNRNDKNRNKNDRNRKDRDQPTSPNALKHIAFTIANVAWPFTYVRFLKSVWEGSWRRFFWVDATGYPHHDNTYGVEPNQRLARQVEETLGAVTIDKFAIIIDNPAFGAPDVYFHLSLPDDPTRFRQGAKLSGAPKEGESIHWTPEPGRKLALKRNKDTNYKEYFIELVT
jgi:hypothetical protein